MKQGTFESINKGFNSAFQANRMNIGMVIPIEHYPNSPVPTMTNHVERVKLIEQVGFKSLWVRDVPFHVPSFGDAGQTYDPFTYLGFLVGHTDTIALGVGSVALPLHHPIHVAKSAATIDQLSGGRLILGVASGDRLDEYPAMGIAHDRRGELFREAFSYIRMSAKSFPKFDTLSYGELKGDIDILPKPKGKKMPMLVTGYSRQSIEWNAKHGDGWISYPKNLNVQEETIAQWRRVVNESSQYDKPFMQPLYVDLQDQDDFLPQPIHLGFRIGSHYLVEYLQHLQGIGVNKVVLNLRFNSADIPKTIEKLGNKVLPYFQS